MNYTEKIQRNSNDILIIPTEDEELFRKKFKDTSTDKKCTMCGNTPKDFQPHPALRVIVCSDCFQYYDNTVFMSNKDGTDRNCRWCAKPCTKYCCSNCTVVFCADCLNRNFESNYVDLYVKSNPEWKCLICNQKQLWALRAQCANAYSETDDELDQSKARLHSASTQNGGDEESVSLSYFEDIPEKLNKNLTPDEMIEAREIFLPSRKNFDRLIDKIKIHCTIFSAVTANRELKNARDVLELTKKVSCMCKCIQDVITWIDGCNKTAYTDWFNKNISEGPQPQNADNDQITSQESVDLLNMQNTRASQETIDDATNKTASHKTKAILQSLRLKKLKQESPPSGVSENFMEFLNEVQDEIKAENPDIKTENNSVFSNKTRVRDSPENESKSTLIPEQNGHVELEKRMADFDETALSAELKTVQYLCDKTGDFFDGFEPLNSGKSTPNIAINNINNIEDSCDEKAHNFDELSDKEKDDSSTTKEEVFSYSPDLIKLLNNDLEEKISEEDDEDTEMTNEIEQEKELIYKYLVDSDCSSYSSMSSISSSSDEEIQIVEEETRGRIQTLDIANELNKLRQSIPGNQTKSSTNSENSDSVKKILSRTCEVRLDRVDFDKMDNLEKKPNTCWSYRVLDSKSKQSESEDSVKSEKSEQSEDSDTEIDKLLNLKSLDKKKRFISSSSSSSSSSIRIKVKKKKFTSKSECDTDSSDDSKCNISSDDILSDFEPENKKNPQNNFSDLVSSDSDFSVKGVTSNDDSEDDTNKDNKNKIKTRNQKRKQTETPAWKKDSLLTGGLSAANKKADKNPDKNKTNEVNNELLEEQETKYLKKTLKDDDNKDPIVLSDTSESESDADSDADSDLIIISNKRKKSDSDGNIPHKKGRKNIKKVLDDSQLQEETQIADLEEEMRKERISMKNRSLDAVLSQSSLSQEDIGVFLDVDEETKTPLIIIPQVLVRPLKPHQVNGIKFMWNVCFESINQIKKSPGTGCILAHCMGLGKTMQVVVLTYTLLTHGAQTGVRHALIICPLSTVFNWRNEFEQTLKNAPEQINIYDLRSDRHRSFMDRVFEVKKWRQSGGVLIMGYDSFTALVNEDKLNARVTSNYRKIVLEALINPGADIVVCDEGHILKNCKTNNFKAIDRVHTKRRILLTGTPLQNNLKEYWHMVSFVKPHLLGTHKEYSNRFVNPIMNGQYEDSSPFDIQLMKRRSHVLHKKLQTTVHRYELSELKQYLPNKHEYVLFVQLTQLQIKLYQLYLEKIKGRARNLFQNFHDLQNIWTHPALLHHRYEKRKTYDEDFDPKLDPDTVNSQNDLGENWYKDHVPNDLATNLNYGSKMIILFSIIRESRALGEKVLVFSSSIPELDLIEGFLKTSQETWLKNVDYYRMDGSVLPEKRMHYCNSFNDGDQRAKLFLISHKVGGLGLNLIAANRVVLMDVNWNPAYDTQSVFRVYRFGQKKPCYIYRLVSLGTMEELVYSRAVTKLAISCRVVDEQQIRRHFKEDDQHKLYKLNTDYLHEEPITPNIPADRLLANLWGTHKPILYNFKDHQSMLENLAHEELNEEEMKIAWEEFQKEEAAERDRLAQLENLKQIYKQQMSQYQPIPNNFQQAQVHGKRALPPMVAGPSTSIGPRPHPPTPIGPSPRPSFVVPNAMFANTSQVPFIPRTPNANNAIPNPFNQFYKNPTLQETETIVPDILTNNTPAHSNFVNLPSTSAQIMPNILYRTLNTNNNNKKKVYGDPKVNPEASPKKMPKLISTTRNQKENMVDVAVELLAKNGVSLSPKKRTKPNPIPDEIINLE